MHRFGKMDPYVVVAAPSSETHCETAATLLASVIAVFASAKGMQRKSARPDAARVACRTRNSRAEAIDELGAF